MQRRLTAEATNSSEMRGWSAMVCSLDTLVRVRARWVVRVVVVTSLLCTTPLGVTLAASRVGEGGHPSALAGTSHVERNAPPDLRVDIDRWAWSPLAAEDRALLEQLYGPNSAPLLWLDSNGQFTPDARQALRMLQNADADGLAPGAYVTGELNTLVLRLAAGATTSEMTSFDLALSLGMLRFIRHLHLGRIDPRTIGFRLDVPRDQHDFPALLRQAVTDHRVEELPARWRPPFPQYDALRRELRRYRALARDASLAPLPASATPVAPGAEYAGAPQLERLLVHLGDLPATTVPVAPGSLYGEPLVVGVKRFQQRHGLEPDGVLGRQTMAALRTPLSWRGRQIELALERLRWIPHLGQGRLIALNIPMFRLWAWDTRTSQAAPRFGMDAIVGRALHTQTPVFVEDMDEVLIRPFWNVPHSIVRNELVPRLERDPDYLRREDFEILRGDGGDARAVALSTEALRELRLGRLRLRQRPGPRNALGLVKFVFPNRENVYMHGTPAQALFARSRRDFSHGCVRVADPIGLATWVLEPLPEWSRERLVAAMEGTDTIRIALPRSIPVVLFYATAAIVPEDDSLHFADDIYGHDRTLDRALRAQDARERTDGPHTR